MIEHTGQLIAVLDEVSTAIHGGFAAVNKFICGFRPFFMPNYLSREHECFECYTDITNSFFKINLIRD
jgi:hypothetical protein